MATLTQKIGRDSNLNSAPARDTLTLSLPGGDAVFLLGDRFRPQNGTSGILEASGQLAKPVGDGAALVMQGDARLRNSPTASDTNYQQAQLSGAWRQTLGNGIATVGAGYTTLRYGGVDLYRATRVSAGRDWVWQSCRPNFGFEAEWRHYPTAPELQGRFTGVTGGLGCQMGADRFGIALRTGHDIAQGDRPGGVQRHTDLRLMWSRGVGDGKVSVDLLRHGQRDADGYSPLLNSGAARAISRSSALVEYSRPLAGNWSALASVEWLAQRSNLELFDLAGRAYFVGLRWSSVR